VALNENLDTETIDPTVRRAFLYRPEKLLLKPPIRIYRWSSRRLSAAQGISPWWSFFESIRLPSGALVDGFRVSEERARRVGRTHREFARARAAISAGFGNTMTELIVVQLLKEVWGLAARLAANRNSPKSRLNCNTCF
jgi:hypothetical protein